MLPAVWAVPPIEVRGVVNAWMFPIENKQRQRETAYDRMVALKLVVALFEFLYGFLLG